MASAKMASAIDVRIDDVGSILKIRIGFPFGENSAVFCQSVWLLESILNFRIGPVSSIGGLIAATLFADTISDCQISSTESQIANHTIPRIAGPETPEFLQRIAESRITGNRLRITNPNCNLSMFSRDLGIP